MPGPRPAIGAAAGVPEPSRRPSAGGRSTGVPASLIARAGAFFTTGDRVNATTGNLDAPAVASAEPAAQPAAATPSVGLATPAAAATIEKDMPPATEPVAPAAQPGAQP